MLRKKRKKNKNAECSDSTEHWFSEKAEKSRKNGL
jgi:hypothetical protein